MAQSTSGAQLAEELKELGLKGDGILLENDYVYVHGDMDTPQSMASSADLVHAPWSPTIAISTAEKWEKELMQDPKVRLPEDDEEAVAYSIKVLTEYRIDSLFRHSRAQTQNKSLPNEQPPLLIPKTSIPRSASKGHPLPTNTPPADAGFSPRQMSSVWLSCGDTT